MDWLIKLFTNPFLVTSLASWFVAQVLKVIINAIVNKKLDFERLVGDGGMPSGHSATVSALATMVGFTVGFDSVEFAIAAVLAVVVMHDASGVRLETSKQAATIISMVEVINDYLSESDTNIKTDKLKVLVGHTPLQVLFGSLLGIAVAVGYKLLIAG